jgi:hypothetical protein
MLAPMRMLAEGDPRRKLPLLRPKVTVPPMVGSAHACEPNDFTLYRWTEPVT